jgi:hypothetical protein
MKLTRSDSLEVARFIASTRARACWVWSVPALACIASVPGLLIALAAGFIVSARAAVWLGVPVLVGLNAFLIWRGTSPRLNCVVAASADRVYVRVFVRRVGRRDHAEEPDATWLDASEIASISPQTIEVFLYGPKPKIVERLVIEPVHDSAQRMSNRIDPLVTPFDPGKQVLAASQDGRLIMDWKWCRPDLREFLDQVARECPSVVIGPEKRSELDLNGIWHGLREEPDAGQRRLLVQAMRLGFARKCVQLLALYRPSSVTARPSSIPLSEAAAYLAKIEREDGGTEDSAVQCELRCGCRREE